MSSSHGRRRRFIRAGLWGAAAAAPAYQQILDLATADGWTAVYDVTNPDTRTLRESGGDSFPSAIADGLGNLPDALQATESKQFKLVPNHFGQIDGMFAAGTAYLSITLVSSFAQPNFILTVAQSDVVNTTDRRICDSASGDTNNHTILMRGVTGNPFAMNAGKTIQGPAGNTNKHIFGALFNGASSVLRNDGVTAVAGDAGNFTLATPITIGRRADLETSEWNGTIGPYLLYDGNPSDAVRDRMEDLLHSLTGIPKA